MKLKEKDYEYIWHPYTHQTGRSHAIPIVRGKKALLFDEDGNNYIDGISSWWVNVHGHANKFIAKKIYQQAKKFQHVIFTSFTHSPAIELAELLLQKLPGSFNKIFYSDNGSTATEVALKMGLQYWQNQGNSKRNKILVFHNAYHGDTFGAMSVSERNIYTYAFREKLFDVVFIETPTQYNLSALKDLINRCQDELACFIYEPLLQGAGGMKMHQPAHLDELLGFIKERNIILIADEVLTGFYRTGKMFAGDYLKTTADIICLSKGLTGGTMALGITACKSIVYNSFLGKEKTRTLYHGHSFTANPLACTAATASLKLFEKTRTKKNIEFLIVANTKFKERLQKWELKTKTIKNIRQTGTVVAFEIVTSEDDGYSNTISADFASFCLSKGVFLRSLGNTIYIMPPYCITKKELKKIFNVVINFLQTLPDR
jgi:adenosylmethionine-8-amino-7-oxononanoate aminotransferase